VTWRKQGLVFSANGQRPWAMTHATLPVAVPRADGGHRIFFTSRDAHNRSHAGYLDIDIEDPNCGGRLSREPLLAPGPLGHFDDHGAFCSSVVEHEGRLFMYYVGWSPGSRPPLFYSAVGLAISEDGGETFAKLSPAPILQRTAFDPWSVISLCVRREDDRWRMWYVSGLGWEETAAGLKSRYHIKYAESSDGIDWRREGVVCIDNRPGEWNIARPCVVQDGDRYLMWYAYNRDAGYRIGYAESDDGISWTRCDGDAGIDVSETGWDSRAIAHPWVFVHRGAKHMVYVGNDHGRAGFGLAVESGETG
jgi:predicted GH43/DUF377 family glycosyl hydrolase